MESVPQDTFLVLSYPRDLTNVDRSTPESITELTLEFFYLDACTSSYQFFSHHVIPLYVAKITFQMGCLMSLGRRGLDILGHGTHGHQNPGCRAQSSWAPAQQGRRRPRRWGCPANDTNRTQQCAMGKGHDAQMDVEKVGERVKGERVYPPIDTISGGRDLQMSSGSCNKFIGGNKK